MWQTLVLATYCVLIIVASLVGGWLPKMMRLTHTRMQVVMSFVAGLMLGVALFHMLPHAVEITGSLEDTCLSVVVGLLAMFFLIRIFHVHQHGHEEEGSLSESANEHHCDDPHHQHLDPATTHRFSWVAVFIGMTLHTSIDGIALAASIKVDGTGAEFVLFGVGTFLAVLLHKPLDSLSITSLMIASKSPSVWINSINVGFALICPAVAALFFYGAGGMGGTENLFVGLSLGFSAGVFLCIALSDLLPEVHFHSHDRLKLSIVLLLGVILAFGIHLIEPAHDHSHGRHGHDASEQVDEHDDHSEHDAHSEHDDHSGHNH